MSRQLRACLLGIVVLNLVFVHITDAVSLHWLIGLYALTAMAPVWWRCQDQLTYRILWNLGIVAIFALLLRDVMQTGIRFMLEDGLLLAAFCQVHVLNNLRRQRTPDLVLFNSFLIALVTSFFCQDLIYSVVFVAYATLLIIATRIFATEADNGRRMDSHKALGLGRSGARHAVVVLGTTFVVFLFWPRNFEREGLVDEEMSAGSSMQEVGFSEEIRLDDRSSTLISGKVVLTAKLSQGNHTSVPRHWRGITYLQTSQHGWQGDRRRQPPGRFATMDPRWQKSGAAEWRRPGAATGPQLEVEFAEKTSRRLYAPLEVHRFALNGEADAMQDGCLRLRHRHRKATETNEPVRYQFRVDPSFATRNGTAPNSRQLRRYRRLRARSVPAAARELYDDFAKRLPETQDTRAVVGAFAELLRGRFSYALPGAPGAAKSYTAFLLGYGGGHCEYFASTLVTLLRTHDVPCRLVGGYLAHEWDEAGRTLTIRRKDAHAWVEAWDDQQHCWFTVDATPPAAETNAEEGAGVLAWLSTTWTRLTTFDGSSRDAVLSWTGEKLVWLRDRPWTWLTGFAVVMALWFWRRQRRGRTLHPAVLSYERALRQAGLEVQTGETPRQLLARARGMELTPARLEALTLATAAHEAQRFE